MFSIDYIKEWSESYKTDLTTDIMPFWLKYGLDKVNGGVYTCVARDGSLMDTTKSVWFQGRFAFICSYAYNNIERNEAWLAAAKSTIDFIEAHCFDSDGRMYFEVTAEGTPLRKRRYIFSESFAAIAMSEYAIASGDQTYAVKALDFDEILVGGTQYIELCNISLELRDICKYPLLGLGRESATYHFYKEFFITQGIDLEPDMEVATSDLMLPLIEKNLGIGFVPEKLAKPLLAEKKLVQIPFDYNIPSRSIQIISDKKRGKSLTADTFYKFCISKIDK